MTNCCTDCGCYYGCTCRPEPLELDKVQHDYVPPRPQYRLTRRGELVFGFLAMISGVGLGMFGGYLIALWFGLIG